MDPRIEMLHATLLTSIKYKISLCFVFSYYGQNVGEKVIIQFLL